MIPIHAAGEHDGILYIAMRFVPGDDLRDAAARGRAGSSRSARSGSSPRWPGARRRPRARPRPPRRQARQRARDAGRTTSTSPTSGSASASTRTPRRRAPGWCRHARLHRARADPRRDDRAVHRRLLARLHDHPSAHRPGPVHGADRGGQAVGALLRAAAAAERAVPELGTRVRRDRRAGDEQAPAGPLRHGGRGRRRGGGRRRRPAARARPGGAAKSAAAPRPRATLLVAALTDPFNVVLLGALLVAGAVLGTVP